MFTRRLALSVLSAALLSAGSFAHAQPSESVSLPLTPELAQKTSITAEGALRKDLAYGVYQTVYSPFDKSLYVASAERAPSVRGGVIYKLDRSPWM
nr:hypothetical protein [Alcaligenes sp. HPC1271]